MLLNNLHLSMHHRLRFTEVNARVLPENGNQSNVRALLKQKFIKKSMLLLVALFICTSIALKAQSPQKINFQSIVRNTNGVIVSNKSVSFKITILSGSITGETVYSETHLKTTDAIGLVSLQIGTGTVSSGVFSSIDWGNAVHFIKLDADFSGGNTYVNLGIQELMSVPYAMYAAKTDTNSLNLSNRLADKAPVNNPTFTGTVGGIDKTMVGLDNVDNTKDEDKQVSSATQMELNAKVNIADTSNMLANYRTGINSKVNIADTSNMLANYQTGINAKVNIADTSNMLANYRSGINAKVNIADTSNMLANYRTGINSKVNIADTSNMLANYQTGINSKVNIADTSNMLANYRSGINAKVNIADTSNMLANYQTGINSKVNIADTSNMLLNYRTGLNAKAPLASPTFTGTVGGITQAMVGLENVNNTTDADKPVSSLTQTALNAKVNTLDTASMLSKYLRKADFPSGSSANEILYWNGTNWVSLSPGTTGQVLTMSSTGLSWGCIVTNTAASPSNVTLVATTPLTPITIATTGATGIGPATGLPAGVTANWSPDEITISGTPTAAGTFNYTIPLIGGCGTVSATGTITVDPAPVCPSATITYNGYAYNTVSIGTQCWMAENLRTDKYSDGITVIPDETANTSGWSGLITGARTAYVEAGVTNYVGTYGYLYNWYAVNDPRKLCPDGWDVPSSGEWNSLITLLGGNSAGGKMKSTGTTYWNTPNTGADNTSGFSGLPGGILYGVQGFANIRNLGGFWTATEDSIDAQKAQRFRLSTYGGNVISGSDLKSYGYSVRCLKD